MKEIKTRIKSVESTKQITKAMELVSSSKFRKAKERAESARPYFNTLYNTVQDIAKNTRARPWGKKRRRAAGITAACLSSP